MTELALAHAAPSTRPAPIFEFDASKSRFAYAWSDIKLAFSRPKLIVTLIKTGFLSKYQGTALGGLWITLTTAMTVSGLAILYGKIFGADLHIYFPYVAIGIVVWGLLSSIINGGAAVFLAASGFFTQTPMSKSLFVIRSLGVAFYSFCFKLIVVAAVLIFVGATPGPVDIALSLAGLVIILWTGFWFALAIGTIGARFRDIGQLTAAALTFSFFLTPVFWQASRLGEFERIVKFNPFYHYLNIVRGPLLDLPGVGESFFWTGLCSAFVTVLGAGVYGLFARRLCYWC